MNNINIRISILALPRVLKRIIVMLVDGTLAIFAVWISYYLRIGNFFPLWERVNEHYAIPACIAAIAISLPIFTMFKLYRTIFRYSGMHAMITVGKAIAVYAFIYSTIFTVIGINGVPRTIGFIQPIILLLLIGFSRFIALYWLGGMYIEQLRQGKKPRALIYGAGSSGRELRTALAHNAEINVLGFLDDNVKLQDSQILGLPVYNPIDIEKIIIKKRVNEIMLALPLVNRYRRNDILDQIRKKNIIVRTIPSYTDLAQGRVTINDIRELSIEDVLRREVVAPDLTLMQRDITGKIVLITGAGGSIGSELCRQIYLQEPKKLILFDHSEFALYTILEELKKLSSKDKNAVDILAYLGSVTDKVKVEQLLEDVMPETIFHTAAYKHVPLVEENKFEGIKNNVFGTLILSKAAISFGIKKFVLISTDKAVRPSNVMGASKRLAEMILQALSTTQNKTIFAMVRFGNVLDSSGSVVPLFRSQIKSGGPVTITHTEVTRYFMTMPEAAQLVIQAGAMTQTTPKSGKTSPIYILDMGMPVKIYDLAKHMIELSGLSVLDETTGEGDIQIKVTGLRAGEKLYEELLIDDVVSDSSHPKIKYANEVYLQWHELNKNLLEIEEAIKVNNHKSVMASLVKMVAGFQQKKYD